MRNRTLAATVVVAVLMGAVLVDASAASAVAQPASPSARPTRPDQSDWEQIKAAARLRRIGLVPHRTARFRWRRPLVWTGALVALFAALSAESASAQTWRMTSRVA